MFKKLNQISQTDDKYANEPKFSQEKFTQSNLSLTERRYTHIKTISPKEKFTLPNTSHIEENLRIVDFSQHNLSSPKVSSEIFPEETLRKYSDHSEYELSDQLKKDNSRPGSSSIPDPKCNVKFLQEKLDTIEQELSGIKQKKAGFISSSKAFQQLMTDLKPISSN